MNTRELEKRRQDLQARSSYLRMRLTAQLEVWHRPLGLADSAASGFHWLRSHPQWVMGGAIALLAIRPRRLLARIAKTLWNRVLP